MLNRPFLCLNETLPEVLYMELQKLNRRHLDFCMQYAIGEYRNNGAKCYQMVGFKSKEPRKEAYKLLRNKLIKDKIADYYRQLDISNERIIAEYTKLVEGSDSRPSDKRAALADLAKIKGMMKDTTENNISIFGDVSSQSPLMDELADDGPTQVTKLAQ